MNPLEAAVVPAAMHDEPARYRLSPGRIAGDLLLLSGQLGFDDDGTIPDHPARQAENVFARIDAVLKAAGLSPVDLVSLTSYHVGSFPGAEPWWRPIVEDYLGAAPYPAWVSVEVAGLAVPGAIVEVSAIALLREGSR